MNDPRTHWPTTPPSASAARAPDVAWWLWAAIGVLVLAGAIVLVYGRAVDYPLVFDDEAAIESNRSIRQLWPLFGGAPNYAPLTPEPGMPMSARPIVNFTFAVNYYFGVIDPAGYHAVNIAIHLLAALVVWPIVARTLRLEYFQGKFESVAGRLGFCVALVWAVHPLATESVEYITQRSELLMALFYLAAMYGSLRYWSAATLPARAAWLAAVAASSVLGALSKEMIASLPAVVLLLERTFVAGSFAAAIRRSWPLYLSLSTCWLVLLAINFEGPRTPQAGFHLTVSGPVWWMTESKVLWTYLKLAFWPWPLTIHYATPYLRTLGEAWPWVLATALLALAIAWLVWRRTSAGFALTAVVAILSPTLFVPLPDEIAVERRMYLPLVALVALVLVGAYAALEKWSARLARPLGATAVGALVAVLAIVSSRRLDAYQNEVTLFEDAIAHGHDDALTRVNLGIQLNKAGRTEEAMQCFERALALKPESYFVQYNLARACEEAGQTQKAIEHYEQALRIEPEKTPAHINLGRLLGAQGQHALSLEHYETAVRLSPDFATAHLNLGAAQLDEGNVDEAIRQFEVALRLDASVDACTNLATAYAMAGRTAEAIATAKRGADIARSRGDDALAEQIDAAVESFRLRTRRP